MKILVAVGCPPRHPQLRPKSDVSSWSGAGFHQPGMALYSPVLSSPPFSVTRCDVAAACSPVQLDSVTTAPVTDVIQEGRNNGYRSFHASLLLTLRALTIVFKYLS